MCGGTAIRGVRSTYPSGLSPRVRGNLVGASITVGGAGSIPACAGEPLRPTKLLEVSGVYPRVCGGTTTTTVDTYEFWGLSPRVRGNLRTYRRYTAVHRSIPACAGEPMSKRPGRIVAEVYPRVCGGTRCARWPAGCATRRSIPACAGEPCTFPQEGVGRGSIPACAGEPPGEPGAPGHSEVYPRVCGGTVQGGRML